MVGAAKLIFFCGKMAAGKSTLASVLAKRENAVLLVQDDLLAALYPGEILSVPDFTKRSSQLRNAASKRLLLATAQFAAFALEQEPPQLISKTP